MVIPIVVMAATLLFEGEAGADGADDAGLGVAGRGVCVVIMSEIMCVQKKGAGPTRLGGVRPLVCLIL